MKRCSGTYAYSQSNHHEVISRRASTTFSNQHDGVARAEANAKAKAKAVSGAKATAGAKSGVEATGGAEATEVSKVKARPSAKQDGCRRTIKQDTCKRARALWA